MNQMREQLTAAYGEQTPEPLHRQKKLGSNEPLQRLYDVIGSDKAAGALIGMSVTGFRNIRKGSKKCTKTVEVAALGALAALNEQMPEKDPEPQDIVALVRIPPQHEATIVALFDALGIKWGSV